MELFVYVKDMHDDFYGCALYITYSTLDRQKMEEYAINNCSEYSKKQLEKGYIKVSDLYKTIRVGEEQKLYLGGYIE